MARLIRFHLDENRSKAVAAGPRTRGIDVTTTPEAGLPGAIDESQLAHSAGRGRVLVTQDEDLLGIHASGIPHAGIVYFKQGARGMGEMIWSLALLWEIYEPDEMMNRLERL